MIDLMNTYHKSRPSIDHVVEDGTKYQILGEFPTLYNNSVWEVLVTPRGEVDSTLKVLLVSPDMDQNISLLTALQGGAFPGNLAESKKDRAWKLLDWAMTWGESLTPGAGYWHLGWDFRSESPYFRLVAQ